MVREEPDNPQIPLYRSMIHRLVDQCRTNPDKLQDLGETIFEIKCLGLEKWIDLSVAEDLAFVD